MAATGAIDHGHDPSVPIAPNVPVMGVLLTATAKDPRLEAGTLCSVMVVGLAGN